MLAMCFSSKSLLSQTWSHTYLTKKALVLEL